MMTGLARLLKLDDDSSYVVVVSVLPADPSDLCSLRG